MRINIEFYNFSATIHNGIQYKMYMYIGVYTCTCTCNILY